MSSDKIQIKEPRKKSRLTKKQLLTYVISGVVALALVVVAVYLIFGRSSDTKVLSVGDATVYKTEYDKVIADAKKYRVDAETARKDIINYYKAKQATKELELEVPRTLIDSNRFIAGYRSSASGDKDSMPRGEWVSKKAYVLAAEANLVSAGRSGVAINLITRPYSGNMSTSEAEEQIAKKIITHVREGIGKGVGDADAVNAVREQDTMSNAIVSSSFLFISSDELAQESGSMTSPLPPEGRDVVKSMKDGELSDVIHSESYGEYLLIRKLYSQQGSDKDIVSEYKSKMNAVRVVEYDK